VKGDRLTDLDAHDRLGVAGDGQGEVAQAAEEVEHTVLLGELEELDRLVHQLPVDLAVDLDEVGRVEVDLHAVVGQGVEQRREGLGRDLHGRSRRLQVVRVASERVVGSGR
jgi:hypothetical protein